MRKNESFKISVKNGLYVGDLCYALSDKVYHGVWGRANYEDGNYIDPESGLEFAMVGTAYGDGYYGSTEGFCFPVDAGIIGIADLSLCEKDYTGLGLSFPKARGEVFIDYEEGTININGDDFCLEIETDPYYENEEDEDWF